MLSRPKKGLLFVVSAPAGTGKTTLVHLLLKEFSSVQASISCTTRAPREGEIDGQHYYFLTREEFERRIAAQGFLEYVELFGHYYGTSKKELEKQLAEGHHVVLTIDTQGAMKLKGKAPAIFIFIVPPSIEEQRQRLVQRKTDSHESIAERIAWSERELAVAKEYDYLIVNDQLQEAYQVMRSILIAEEHRLQHFEGKS